MRRKHGQRKSRQSHTSTTAQLAQQFHSTNPENVYNLVPLDSIQPEQQEQKWADEAGWPDHEAMIQGCKDSPTTPNSNKTVRSEMSFNYPNEGVAPSEVKNMQPDTVVETSSSEAEHRAAESVNTGSSSVSTTLTASESTNTASTTTTESTPSVASATTVSTSWWSSFFNLFRSSNPMPTSTLAVTAAADTQPAIRPAQ